MKRLALLTTIALMGLAASSWGAGVCLNHGIHCICPPPENPDCSCPCDHRLHMTICGPDHAQKLIEKLHSDCCCDRIKAAEKLGSRFHADFCCQPEVLDALVGALLCDECWEVRRAAAWSIAYQNARTDLGVGALYLASKYDSHFLVRDAANDALNIVILCRRPCFKELFAKIDEVVKELRKVVKKEKEEKLFCYYSRIAHATMGALGFSAYMAPVATTIAPPLPESIRTMPEQIPAPTGKEGKGSAQGLPSGPASADNGATLLVPPTSVAQPR